MVSESGQFDTLVAMVAEGASLTLLPEMARQHYRHSGVRLVDFAPRQTARTLGLVPAKQKFVTPSTHAFMEYLRQVCRAQGSSAPAAPDRVLSGGRAPAARRNGARLAS
ncbi:MAG TPA: LysR family transcriptional regulator substrate-binding protein [Terriglobia bacterium]